MESFDLGSTVREITYFWLFILCLIISTAIAGPLGFLLVGGIGASLLALRRNFARKQIRERLGIYGSGVEDFWGHCCCTCFSVCQEAREVKFANLPVRDYCSGELLVPDSEVDSDGDLDMDLDMLLQDRQQLSFVSLLGKISKTSKFLLGINAAVAIVACGLLIFSDRSQNILVLVLVFVQPFLILYFIYWRWLQAYSRLDYVIKMFAVGFWFSTFQSIIIESIIQVVLSVIFSIFAGATAPSMDDHIDDEGGGTDVPPTMMLLKFLQRFSSPFSAQEGIGDEGAEEGDESPPPNIVIFMLYQVAVAYVLAAGTEETMKHFAVRCCQFPSPLKSPQMVLMYLFSAALGFATSENIEYVFGVASATKQSKTSAIEEELFVLAVRVLMPVHLICSVLQASSLSTVILYLFVFIYSCSFICEQMLYFVWIQHLFGQRQMSLFWVS